jgi:hypothetical protein
MNETTEKERTTMAFMQAPASAGNGDFTPILAYKANQGRLYVRDRVQDASGQWDSTETEVTRNQPAFALDFGSLEVGWCHFVAGMAPQWLMVAYGQPMPDRPASPGLDDKGKALNYRNGFRIKVAGNAIGGVREFAGNSAALINGMNEVHTQFEASPEAAMGKIPVVKMVDTIAVKTGQSTNFQPVFAIQAWVDRPDVLGPRTVPAPGATAAPVQAARPVAPAQPAAAPVAPAPAAAASTGARTMAEEMPF